MNNQPVGILDSGVGGLTIWKEIAGLLPHESTIYIADSKNCPYGNRSPEQIYGLSRRLIKFLIEKNCKLIVLACNTITVTCLDRLREEFPDAPIVGTVPVVKTASERTKNGRIGIFSTVRTAVSQYQKDLIEKFAGDCEVINIGTDKLVPLIEQGGDVRLVLKSELEAFKSAGVDVLALGCSHFPLIKDKIQKILGSKVLILDSGAAITRQVARVLQNITQVAAGGIGNHEFYTTGDKDKLREILKTIGYNVATVNKVDL